MMKSGSNSEVKALPSTCSRNQTNNIHKQSLLYFAYDIVAYLQVKSNNVILADASRIGGISQFMKLVHKENYMNLTPSLVFGLHRKQYYCITSITLLLCCDESSCNINVTNHV